MLRGTRDPLASVPDMADSKYVDLRSEHGVRFWMNEFRVDETTLRSAVKAVGTSPAAIRKYLGDGKIRD
jgi:hypothetical protein